MFRGQLAVDPAAATGKAALGGELVSDVDVVATLSDISEGLTLEAVDLTAKASLRPSTIAGFSIENGSIDGDLRNDVFTIRMFDVKGRDLNLSATGTLALNESDESDLKFQADTPSLDEIGMILDKPLKGIARIDGTVTGNRRELKASGNLNGNARCLRGRVGVDDDDHVQRPGVRPGVRRGKGQRGDCRDVRDSCRSTHQRAQREDRLRRSADQFRRDGKTGRTVSSQPPALCCCIRTTRKCTCGNSTSPLRTAAGSLEPGRSRRFNTAGMSCPWIVSSSSAVIRL